jgi:hypothetical protein
MAENALEIDLTNIGSGWTLTGGHSHSPCHVSDNLWRLNHKWHVTSDHIYDVI